MPGNGDSSGQRDLGRGLIKSGRLAFTPIADSQFMVDPSGMSFRMLFSVLGVAAAGMALGWFAHQYYANEPCRFMAQGYKSVRLDTRSLRKFPLDRVPDGVFLAVQRCWAGTPYEGPIHVLGLVDAFETKSRDYYLAFQPSGVTDVQILFLISHSDQKPVAAFQRSTL